MNVCLMLYNDNKIHKQNNQKMRFSFHFLAFQHHSSSQKKKNNNNNRTEQNRIEKKKEIWPFYLEFKLVLHEILKIVFIFI